MKSLLLCAFLLTTSLLLQFTLLSCNHEDKVVPDTREKQLQEKVWKSKSQYIEAMNARKNGEGVKFTIEEVERKDNLLSIKVSGGCQENSFKAIWDGTIMESYPMIIHLVLTHDKTTENCQDASNFTFNIDLHALLGSQARLEDYHFRVSNGSDVQDLVVEGNTPVKSK
jgi:hypothetical protein